MTTGKRYHDLPRTSLETFGYSIHAIKAWRLQQQTAGRPSSLEDFYTTHGLCWHCKATSINPYLAGLDGDIGLYEPCPACNATGLAPSPSP